MTIGRAILAFALIVRAVPAVGDSDATGRWVGTMQRGKATLPIAIDVPGGEPLRATFTARDVGAMDVPLHDVKVSPRDVGWELVGDRTTTRFSGMRTGDAIRGTFSEGGSRGIFTLHRRSRSTERPYTAADVEFVSGGVKLAGTVLSPRARGRHPGIVFIHGSGPEGRWANAVMADDLARHGIVALIYDKRGVGRSGGDWKTSTLEDLAGDARAAVHLMATRRDVDPSRVGVYGHSQGGFIAPMVADRNGEVAWIIDADGNVGPQYEQDLFRVNTELAKHYKGQELRDAMRFYGRFVEVARNGEPHESFNRERVKWQNAPWFRDVAVPDDTDWIWSWYRRVGNDDNRAAWAAVRVPVLLLYGENDEIVPARASIAEINKLLKGSVTVRVLRNADHTLRVPPTTPEGWPHYAAGLFTTVREWIMNHS
ncbi:MAG: alpha/beta hydrolase family protein [Acidobacteriota bacterium]